MVRDNCSPTSQPLQRQGSQSCIAFPTSLSSLPTPSYDHFTHKRRQQLYTPWRIKKSWTASRAPGIPHQSWLGKVEGSCCSCLRQLPWLCCIHTNKLYELSHLKYATQPLSHEVGGYQVTSLCRYPTSPEPLDAGKERGTRSSQASLLLVGHSLMCWV